MKTLKSILTFVLIGSINHLYTQTPGSLDLTFSLDGKQTTAIGFSCHAKSVVVQPDGKIIVAGISSDGVDYDFTLVRYNSDGTLDLSFDSDGIVTTDYGNNMDEAYSVALQADGKIVVAGSNLTAGDYDFALTRYNTDGSLDITFDADGKLKTDFGSLSDVATSVAIQADGKIVATGYTNTDPDDDIALARYLPDGSLDASFDGDGKVITSLGIVYDHGWSIAIQPDGKIIVGGYGGLSFSDDFALVRYNTNGSLDTSFSGDGKLTTDFGANEMDRAYAIALQTDGKILLAGVADNGPNDDFAVIRYTANGSLDNSFSGDGKLLTDFGNSDDEIKAILVQPDGKILVVGYTDVDTNVNFGLVRYNTNGSLDAGFGTGGKLTTDFTGTGDRANAVALQPDGKIVVVGATDNFVDNFAVARYISGLDIGLNDFSLDNSMLIYPNPFLQDIYLKYVLNNSAEISISLFNMQGEIVETFIHNEHQAAGEHSQHLSLPELVSGTYLLVIQTAKAKRCFRISAN